MTSSRSRTIYTSMVGDLFHIGHLNLLRRARALGTRLIVGVISDECVLSYKSRVPIISLAERMEIISALSIVDDVMIQTSRDGSENVRRLLDVKAIVRGDDAILIKEKRLIESRGGEYILLPRTEGISTSDLIARIRSRDASAV